MIPLCVRSCELRSCYFIYLKGSQNKLLNSDSFSRCRTHPRPGARGSAGRRSWVAGFRPVTRAGVSAGGLHRGQHHGPRGDSRVVGRPSTQGVSMKVGSVSALLAVLLVRPTSQQFLEPPLPWSSSWDPRSAAGPPGLSGRTAASSRDSSVGGSSGGGAQPFHQSSFSESHQSFPQSSPFSQSSLSLTSSPPSLHPPFLPVSPPPSSFSPTQSSLSPPNPGSSVFGHHPETPAHTTQQYQECPYGWVCVDEYFCPSYGRLDGARAAAGPRTFNQPLSRTQSGPGGSPGPDSGPHGGRCGYSKVCCKQQYLSLQGPPPHLNLPGPTPGGHGGHLAFGGPLPAEHLGHGAHSAFAAYPIHAQSYFEHGHGVPYPSYSHVYGDGYSQYPSYTTPYYPSYPVVTSYPAYHTPYPPPLPPYPLQLRFPGAAGGLVPPLPGRPHPGPGEAGGQQSQTLKTDGGQRTPVPAPTAARTSRMFPQV